MTARSSPKNPEQVRPRLGQGEIARPRNPATYSYSIKKVEKLAGYKRTLPESNGDWSMAQHIKAVETEDDVLRRATMVAICKYNKEDLEATWAVMRWSGTM